MTTIACVLRSGGDFEPKHVARLAEQVHEHAQAEFACLTDGPEEVELYCGALASVMRLKHDWPGWWSKIEVFTLPGPALYLDLDVTILEDLGPLLEVAARHEFVMLRDFWGMHPHGLNSSVVGWRDDVSELYREFAAAPKAHMDLYRSQDRWGDQGFLRDHWRGEMRIWQDLLPGSVLSFKREARVGADMSNARILVSHAQPRPWQRNGGADEWLRSSNRATMRPAG